MDIHSITNNTYSESLSEYKRFKTREVSVGGVTLGGSAPIRLQSMTTTDTMDTQGTVEQSIRMIEAGCEIVRITAPSKREAENLAAIQKDLRARGYDQPICADIHFTPNAAEIAARIVGKVRINPGNYADKKKFQTIDYTDASYEAELDRIRKRFTPLILICKEEGTAMRIGTNHGSLSDRIMSRYGDSPLGMVESALEFLRICEDESFHDIVLSMKASNTQVMVQAYRLLVNRMIEAGMNYPLHLGVTEAGDGEDGRIKSAVGIGTLLEDGLGDTVRVSLTEEPEYEIPVCRALVERYSDRTTEPIPDVGESPVNPFEYSRRESHEVLNIGAKKVPIVMADYSLKTEIKPANLFPVGYQYSVPLDKWNLSEMACDYVFVGENTVDFQIPGTLGIVQMYSTWKEDGVSKERHYPFLNPEQYLAPGERSDKLNFVYACLKDLTDEMMAKIKADPTAVLLIDTYNPHGMAEERALFIKLMNAEMSTPVVIGKAYENLSEDQIQLYAATDMGGLLIDGLGDGIFIAAENSGADVHINRLGFGILQATRTRISKTEYISCPSCGRTLFDLQETTARISERTNHLKGVKIGIMGCIVNGPGEMADADYGYVGTGVGKISLYKEKEVVRRAIPAKEAVDSLIDLIKEHGDWVEPA